MMIKRLIPLFAVIVTLTGAGLAPAWAQDARTSLASDLARTFGFYSGQKMTIQRIQREFPALASYAEAAQSEFDLVFKGAHENVEATLEKIMSGQWVELRRELLAQLAAKLGSSTINPSQAELFLREVRDRAKGRIESPVIETLLIYEPQFQRNPAMEFAKGFTRTFNAKNHPKAKGLDFRIQYPMSWRAKEGERPNVVQVITSENGRGSETIILLVKELPLPSDYKWTKQDIDDVFSPQGLRDMMPEEATFVSGQPIVMDRQPAGMAIFDSVHQRIDFKVSTRTLQFVTVYRNRMISVQCATSALGDRTSGLVERFKGRESLFKLVANSFVLQSQY